ncbi:MAG TPA: DUF1697 domain-containing protein [Candidatus Eremiobacteraceae bacterium]|nr:DUF1697 domain-containing protein [Candidatus Eremiobacteraceae bacterium]
MPTYIAMLRGINVSGHNVIPMAVLRELCEALGYTNVKTYVQSGNVIFDSRDDSAKSAAKRVEAKILSALGHEVPAIIQTRGEMRDVIAANPFVKQKGIDPRGLHITFLPKVPTADGVKLLESRDAGPDRFAVIGRQVYLFCPQGYGKSKLSNSAIEKAFGVPTTTRNWKTVNMLMELATP